jgi:hypothetical protein
MQICAIHLAYERADIHRLRPLSIRICHDDAPTNKPLEHLQNRTESWLYPGYLKMRGFVSHNPADG